MQLDWHKTLHQRSNKYTGYRQNIQNYQNPKNIDNCGLHKKSSESGKKKVTDQVKSNIGFKRC